MFSWSDAVKTVAGMLERGTFATNVELAEAQNAEIQRAAQSIWYMNSDISEELRGNYFKQVVLDGIFPESTARISEMLRMPRHVKLLSASLKDWRMTIPKTGTSCGCTSTSRMRF